MVFLSGPLSRNEIRRLRREKRKEERKLKAEKERKAKTVRKIASYVIAFIVIAGIGFGIYSFVTTGGGEEITDDIKAYMESQLSSIPNSFVHWHADLDVVICGEERTLPEAPPRGLLGVGSLHTHDRATNLKSLPSSDGNGVIHLEANIHDTPFQHTIGKFMENIGIAFDKDGIMEYKNGDLCPDGKAGKVRVFVNGQEIPSPNFLYYIPRDGDFIKIEFGPAETEQN